MFDLTVVIPSHNKGKYLIKCLDSIMYQSYQVKEIIVYDDCSTDDSIQLLHDYQKKCSYLTIIQQKENVGVSVARDTAIKAAKTDYITFIDADDFYWDSSKLKKEMETAKAYYSKTGKYPCTYSQTVLVDETGNRKDRFSIKNWDKYLRLGTVSRLYKYWIPRDYCFPRAAYIDVGGFDCNMCLYEDWDLNLRLLAKYDFVFSGCYGTAYRLDTGGLASVNFKKHYEAKKQVFHKNNQYLQYSIFEILLFDLLLKGSYVKAALSELSSKFLAIRSNYKKSDNIRKETCNGMKPRKTTSDGKTGGGKHRAVETIALLFNNYAIKESVIA